MLHGAAFRALGLDGWTTRAEHGEADGATTCTYYSLTPGGQEIVPIPMEGIDVPEEDRDKIMHVALPIGEGQTISPPFIVASMTEAIDPQPTDRVLEIQDSAYTQLFGHDVDTAHSIDINPTFNPTYVCDLAQSKNVIPDATYDCFLLPNTLCVLRDIEDCLRQALRVIRPRGVILASTAALVPLTGDASDYWHLSAAGWHEVAARAWGPAGEYHIESHGNCLAAVAAMLGLAHEELDPAELDVNDPRYPVLVTLFCRRRS